MGKSNQQPKTHAAKQPQLTPFSAQNLPRAQQEVDSTQNRKIDWALGISIISAIITVFAVYWTYRATQAAEKQASEAATANKLAQTANDRASGKLKAHFDFVEDKKATLEKSKRFMKTARTERGDEEVFRIDSVDELIFWGPRVKIKNTGEEIIDCVRIEVTYDWGVAYGPGVSQISPVPFAIKDRSDAELASFGKLMPQKTMTIAYAPLLLEQLMAADFGKFSENDRWGNFTVRVLCRIGGASNYDQMETGGTIKLRFHWKPTGFKDEKKVNDILKLKATVELD